MWRPYPVFPWGLADLRYVNITGDTMTGALVNEVSVTSPTYYGSSLAGGDVSIQSTSHANKGSVFLGETLEIEADGSAPGADSYSIVKFDNGDRIYSQRIVPRMFYTSDRFEILSRDGVESIASFNSSASANADRIVFYKGISSGSYAAIAPPTNGGIFSGNFGIGTSSPATQFHLKMTANTDHTIEGNNNFASTVWKKANGTTMGFIGYSNAGGYITGSINGGMHMRATNGWSFGQAATLIADMDSSNGVRVERRLQGKQGSDVASANDLTLGDGNTFEITGTTQINAITTTNWQNGAEVNLLFTSNPTVKHNTAGGANTSPILLSGSADFAASSGDILTLLLSEIGGTRAWREKSRTVI